MRNRFRICNRAGNNAASLDILNWRTGATLQQIYAPKAPRHCRDAFVYPKQNKKKSMKTAV